MYQGKSLRSQHPVPATQASAATLPRMSLFRKTFLSRHVFCCGLKGLELAGPGKPLLYPARQVLQDQTMDHHSPRSWSRHLLFWGLQEFHMGVAPSVPTCHSALCLVCEVAAVCKERAILVTSWGVGWRSVIHPHPRCPVAGHSYRASTTSSRAAVTHQETRASLQI